MYLGRIVEEGPAEDIIRRPRHPYTVALLSATPTPDPAGRGRRLLLRGDPPSPIDRPSGCAFHPRCPVARERCSSDAPPLASDGPDRRVACFFPGELAAPWPAPPSTGGP
jgi:oligopeptide/dipeptide ABC transporter ATP-binding protein